MVPHLMSRSVLPPLAALAVLALGTGSATADRETRVWKLSLESGAEYDSNLHRVEVLDGQVAGVDAGPLMRAAARYKLSDRPDKRSQLRLDLRGGGKLFAVPEGQSENLGVIFADLNYQRRLGESQAVLGVRGNYFDAIDIRPFGDGVRPTSGRSFRTREIRTFLTLPRDRAHRLSIQAGVRDFVYKPDADYSWRGPLVGLRYASTLWLGNPDTEEDAASIDIRASYQVGLRSYDGAAFRNACAPGEMPAPDCFVPTEESRSDLNHLVIVEGLFTGKRIYSLLYGAEVVDSNSYGQASVRQRVVAGFTSVLVADIFLTARAIVRLNTFLDPLLLARDLQNQNFVSIEDENRNSLSLHLARDLTRHWGAEARFAVYSNEFATQELRFRRQTAYIGLLYRFEGDSSRRL